MSESVGILGGTGPAGRGVAVRLAVGGYDVTIGSRDAERAAAVAAELNAAHGTQIGGLDNAGAAACATVIVATPWESTLDVVSALREPLADKVVISMVNALLKRGREFVPVVLGRGSVAAELQAVLPQSRVGAAFHHLPAAQMEDLNSGLAADVLVLGDTPATRAAVVALVGAMPGLRPVEAGSLSLAGAVEAFTAVCITVNVRHKAHAYVQLAGLGE